MARVAFCVVAALMALSCANAASYKWTGYAKNGQWDTTTNWYPAGTPGPEDSVQINKGGNVTITTPVTVNSIDMGNDVGHFPFLIVDSSLLVTDAITVNANGGIVMASGASMVSGTVTMGGTLVFTSGTASGAWTIASPGKAMMGGGAEKAFSGCQFNIGVDVEISGLFVLNQSSTVSTTSTITASGALSLQNGDGTSVQFDTSKGTFTYKGDGTFQVMAPWKVGTFNFMGGNLTIFESVTFGESFDVPSGSTLKTLGVASVNLPAGLTGSGYVHVEGKAFSVGGANFSGTVNAQAGTFASSAASTIATLAVTGSSVTVDHKFAVASISMTAGEIVGSSTLTITTGTLNSAGFNINASTIIMKSFKVTGSVISLGSMGKITIDSGATFTAASTSSISGPAKTGGITNNGIIDATGAFSITNIDLSGSGSVTVSDEFQVGTLKITQGMIALSGNGKFLGATTDIASIGKITGTPGVTGSIGSYSFSCKKECDNIMTSGIPTTTFIFAVSKN